MRTSRAALAVPLLLSALACERRGHVDDEASAAPPGATAIRAAKRTVAPLEHVDPPAAPGALGPGLLSNGDTLTMSWIEPSSAPDQHRVQVAELAPSGWGAPQTVVDSNDLIANWADFPQLGQTRGGLSPFRTQSELGRRSTRTRWNSRLRRMALPSGKPWAPSTGTEQKPNMALYPWFRTATTSGSFGSTAAPWLQRKRAACHSGRRASADR